MRTRSPISTISFNTPDYLLLKLNELTSSGKISFWSFIMHRPEDDEAGGKDHIHLYIEPSKIVQTDDLRKAFLEYDPQYSVSDYSEDRVLLHDNPDDHVVDPDVKIVRKKKPRGCLLFRNSKFSDWYLYGLHDKRYLSSKGQSRKYHYSHDDIVSSDYDDLLFLSRSIDLISLSPYADMEEAQRNGVTFAEYFRRGTVPLPQVVLFERAWYLLQNNSADRAGRSSHSPCSSVDEDTKDTLDDYVVLNKKSGEILESD